MSDNAQKTVLIVEDEKSLLTTIDLTLKDKGYRTLTASDGEQAFNKITDEKPDLVLLDILLPKKTGLEILQDMKKNGEIANIPVLLFTNLSDEESISQGVALGARGYFVKSDMTLAEIAAKVQEIFEEA